MRSVRERESGWTPPKLLGADPGLANFGMAVLEVTPGRAPMLLHLSTTRTSGEPKKKRTIHLADENFIRTRAIGRALDHVLVQYNPAAIAAESFAWVRDASSAAKTAMTWGVLALACERASLPLASLGSQDVKKALCGKRDASKESVEQAARKRLARGSEHVIAAFEQTTSATHREHAWDALATALVALEQSEVIRAVVRAAP
jgi:Holliday junction resolvasome RuvABC endonuclease subunit